MANLSRYEVTAEECDVIVDAAKDHMHFKNVWKYLNHKRSLDGTPPINRNWLFLFMKDNGCKSLPESVEGFKTPSVLPKPPVEEPSDIEITEVPKELQEVLPKNEDWIPSQILSKQALQAIHVFYRLGEVSNLVLKKYMGVGYNTAFLLLAELEYLGIVKKNDGPKGRYSWCYNESQLRSMFPNQIHCSYREMDYDYQQEELRIKDEQDAAMRAAGYVFDENEYRWFSPEEIKERRIRAAAQKRHETWERKHQDAAKKAEDDLEARFEAFVAIVRSQANVDAYIRMLTSKGYNPFVNRMINTGLLEVHGWTYSLKEDAPSAVACC